MVVLCWNHFAWILWFTSQLLCKVGPLSSSLHLSALSSAGPRRVRDHGLLGMLNSCVFLLGPWGTISTPFYADLWGGMTCGLCGRRSRNRETQRDRTNYTAKATNSRDGPGFSLYPFFKKFLKKYLFLFIQLHQILVAALRIFRCSLRDLYSWGMWTLSYNMWDLVPWPRIKPQPPSLGV